MLLQHCVKIGAAKAERTHTSAARMGSAGQPRALLGVDIKRRRLGIGCCCTFEWLRDLDGRRQDLLVQGHCRLDDASYACGRFGMADL